MYDKISYTTGDELCEQMAQECDTCLVSFSCGKDSVATWLQCRKYFKNIVPFHHYLIPDLDFVKDNIKYYEDFFGQHIFMFPSVNLFGMLRSGTFQNHERWTALCALMHKLPDRSYDNFALSNLIRDICGLSGNVYCAIGNRKTDSPMRRMALSKSGAINHNRKLFYPIYDWNQERLLKEIDDAGLKLATDYNLWSNTFDSLSYKYLSKMRETFPNDYQKVLDIFPMSKLEFTRRGEDF